MIILLSTEFQCLMGVEYFIFIFIFLFGLFGFFSFLVSFKDRILKASPASCSTPGSITLIGGLDPYEIFPS